MTTETSTRTYEGTQPSRRRRRPLRGGASESASWYLLIGPSFIVLLAVTLVPLVLLISYSLFSWNLAEPDGRVFSGLENFTYLLSDPTFWHSAWLTAYQVTGTVVLQLAFGLPISLLLFRRFRGRSVLRVVYLIPIMTPPVVAGLMWKMLLNTDRGMVNYLLSLVGIGSVDWLGDTSLAMPSVILVDVWLSTPFVVILLLAGLQSIPGEVFDAAKVDGAGSFKTFLWIVLPLLKPMIFLVLLFRTMDAIRRFDSIYVMTGGGPGNATETLDLHAFFTAFQHLDVGRGSAVAAIMLAIMIVISSILLKLVRNSTAEM